MLELAVTLGIFNTCGGIHFVPGEKLFRPPFEEVLLLLILAECMHRVVTGNL